MSTQLKALVAYAEVLFDTEMGEPRAFFEIGDTRVIYVMYVNKDETITTLVTWMRRLLDDLIANGGVKLYWRNPEKIRLDYSEARDEWCISARIAVLDKDMNRVDEVSR